MSLLVTLVFGATTYSFRGETVVHNLTRFPVQESLPYLVSDFPQVFTLDQGLCLGQITVSGLVNTSSEGGDDPSKVNLENVCRTWWDYGPTPSALPILTIGAGGVGYNQYYVHIKNADFRQEAGKELYWIFNITFVVRGKVPVPP